ncbi:MAG TPA: hypothetical protein VLZ84_04160 [Asticcacaulis sp.]|nr:hypothetical protein [Asticcacaulis sp.]
MRHVKMLAGAASFVFQAGAHCCQGGTVDWQVSGALDVATEGVSKGADETAGRGQVRGALEARRGPIFVNAQWRNLHEADSIDGQQEYGIGLKGQAKGFDVAFSGGYKIKDGAHSGFDSHCADAPGVAQADNFIEAGLSQGLNARSLSGAVGNRRVSTNANNSAVNLM